MTKLPRVCILTAGRGTRMGALGTVLNKALFPVDKKAALSHLISKFPSGTEFVIATGFKSEQVETYLRMAHPDITTHLVKVDPFEGPGTGPGASLLACKRFLEDPFYFVSCDTLWNGVPRFPTDRDWAGVAEVTPEESPSFCNYELDFEGRVLSVKDKQRVSGDNFRAFVGLLFVKSVSEFWSALARGGSIAGEHQISHGITELVDQKRLFTIPIDWLDTGTAERYAEVLRRFDPFDFSKSNETFYIVNDRVIKFFADTEIATRRVNKQQLNPKVFPAISFFSGSGAQHGFYSYPLVPGHTLYQRCTPSLFRQLLDWLDTSLWIAPQAPVSPHAMQQQCSAFYHKKTMERLNAYKDRYDAAQLGPRSVNGIKTPSVSELLAAVPWDDLTKGDAVFFHGDLQFDNILYSPETKQFTLIDWRQDFAGEIGHGDRYYDLAKLNGGILLNYDLIKGNHFQIDETSPTDVFIEHAQRTTAPVYREILQRYVTERGLNWRRVELLTAIIFLNMAPLHHPPFDRFLMALAQRELHNLLTRN